MMNKKQGFTFSEMLITMGIMAVILMILIPAVKNLQPNQSLVMFKKAYYVAERAVSEIVNDDDFYPEVDDPDANPFLGNIQAINHQGETYQGQTKFCRLFAQKLNIKSNVNCSASKQFVNKTVSEGQFTTSDGVVWVLPITNFASDSTKYDIYMDVNGDRGPNCLYSANCSAPDRFNIKIYQNGRLVLEGKREQQYLGTTDVSKTAGDFDKEEKEKQQQGN